MEEKEIKIIYDGLYHREVLKSDPRPEVKINTDEKVIPKPLSNPMRRVDPE